MLAKTSLQNAGHEVDTADDGAAALEALQAGYDAVIVDLVMPHIDGFRLIALIRSTPALEDLPIVVLSSRNDASAVEEAYRLGRRRLRDETCELDAFPRFILTHYTDSADHG